MRMWPSIDDFGDTVDESRAFALEMTVDPLGLEPHYRALVRSLKGRA
jgi:hypothetical protein